MSSEFLQTYRNHVAERAVVGIPPLPLSATQTGEVIELLKNPPKGEEAFLVELITHRVPAGVDDAAKVKASYLAAVAHGTEKCELISREKATQLLGTMPVKNLRIYNRGISGHKVFQLADRWDDDCLQLRPDVLSILIGVNDFWHTLSSGYTGTVQTYETDFRKLLERTKKELPATRLIICEPFAVAGGTAITDKWKDFEGYRIAAKKLAGEFGASFVPFQTVFDEALKLAPASYWCPDGVHPSLAGAYLMKEAWLKTYVSK